MPTDKPLPDTDDDIIDLTDLVEEPGTVKAPADGGSPADLSFENELDDLFGDVEPDAPAPKPEGRLQPQDDEEDLIDLAGLELDEPADVAGSATPAAAAKADEDIFDLSDLDVPADDAAAEPGDTAEAQPDDAGLDDLFKEFDAATAQAAPAPDALDAFDDLPAVPAPDEPMILEPEPEAQDAVPTESAAPAEEAVAPVEVGLDAFEDAAVLDEAPAPAAPGDDDDTIMDVAGMDFLSLEEDGAAPDHLQDADEAEAVDVAALPDIEALAEPVAAVPDVPSPAAAPIAMPAAASGPTQVGGIDLGALDTLIDHAKGPVPLPEAEALPDLDALLGRIEALEAANAALTARLEALAAAAPDEATLAAAVANRLEETLAGRLEALLDAKVPAPDFEGLKNELLADIEAARPDEQALLDRLGEALAPQFDALRQEMAAQAAPSDQADATTAALEALREAVARMEALGQGRQTQFDDFTTAMDTRLAELRRELPEADAFVSPRRLAEDLDSLRQTLMADLENSLDARFAAVTDAARQAAEDAVHALGATLDARIESLEASRVDAGALTETAREIAREEIGALAETLTGRIEDLETTRLDVEAVASAARKAARDEAGLLGEALSGRIEALENDRIDPEALAGEIRSGLSLPDPGAVEAAAAAARKAGEQAGQALARLEGTVDQAGLDAAIDGVRSELTATIEKKVPQAAATVIREEIAALAKDFL